MMTEQEYVETIRKVAREYIELICNPEPTMDGGMRTQHWQQIKEKLSPHTAVALCDAWLEKNRD